MFRICKALRVNLPPILTKKLATPAYRPTIIYPNRYIKLIIPSVLNQTRCPIFHIPLEMSKVELKNYLETFYGMRIKKVHTAIIPGRVKRNFSTKKFSGKVHQPSYKKAFVYVKEDITLPWSEEVKKEIMRYYDRKLNKKLKLEEQKAKIKEMQQKQKTAQAGGTPK